MPTPPVSPYQATILQHVRQSLSQRAAFANAAIVGQGVVEYESKGKAAGEVARVWRWLKGKV